MADLQIRFEGFDWDQIGQDLEEHGYSRVPHLLGGDLSFELRDLYSQDGLFRSRIDMARFRFGIGEYKYFAYPLPDAIDRIRRETYPPLARLANEWSGRLGAESRYPERLDQFLEHCHEQGQARPTPLLLTYATGGYNCMHQDLYGAVAFPFQLACVLSRPGVEFTGGEFLLMEQRPRAQTRAEAIPLEQGEAIIFPNRYRPIKGSRGYYRATMRHGVSRLLSGNRVSLGIIYHDAE